MSRLMATAGGLTYDLPQDSIARQMAAPPVRGGATGSPSGQNLDPLSKLMEDELYQQEGRTQEYYTKVGALQTFAKQAASAGIDVTTPDYTNPQSIKYHNIYQQALADIYNTRNDLTRLKSFENESMKDPNLVRSFDDSGNPVFAQTGQTAFVKQFQDQAAQVKSEPELLQFNQNKKAAIQELQARMSSAIDPRERAQFRSQIDQLSQINPGIGISPYQQASLDQDESQFVRSERNKFALDAAKAAREASKGGAGKDKAASRLLNLFDIAANEDTGQLATISGIQGAEFISRPSGKYLQMYSGDGEALDPIKIDVSSFGAFKRTMASMNGALNRSPGSEGGGDVSNEDLIAVFDELNEDQQKALYEQVKSGFKVEDDVLDEVKQLIGGYIRPDASSEELELLSQTLNSVQGAVVPDSIFKKAGNKYDIVVGVEASPAILPFGLGSNEVKIILSNNKGDEKPVTLNLSNEKDRQMLKDFIEDNADYIPMQALETLLQ